MILRSLEPADAERDLPLFHAFIYHPVNFPSARKIELEREGAFGYPYYNVLTTPCPEWTDGDWGDFVKTLPVLTTEDGREAKFPWYQCSGNVQRGIIGWDQVTKTQLYAGAEIIIRSGLHKFFDLYFPTLEDWFFDPAGNVRLSDFTPEQVLGFASNLSLFRTLVEKSKIVLVNGDWSSLWPVYLEHAERNLLLAAQTWQADQRNVFSCDPRYGSTYEFMQHQYKRSRWIAFSSSAEGPHIDEAYAEMAEYHQFLERVEAAV